MSVPNRNGDHRNVGDTHFLSINSQSIVDKECVSPFFAPLFPTAPPTCGEFRMADDCLLSKRMTTDQIRNVVERCIRPGSDYREIESLFQRSKVKYNTMLARLELDAYIQHGGFIFLKSTLIQVYLNRQGRVVSTLVSPIVTFL